MPRADSTSTIFNIDTSSIRHGLRILCNRITLHHIKYEYTVYPAQVTTLIFLLLNMKENTPMTESLSYFNVVNSTQITAMLHTRIALLFQRGQFHTKCAIISFIKCHVYFAYIFSSFNINSFKLYVLLN